MRPAVFIDRDDTLIATRDMTADTDHVGDLVDPDLVRLIPGCGEACRLLADTGVVLVVISNQGAVARGCATLQTVEAVNDRIRHLLALAGAKLTSVYYAPHHPEGPVPEWTGNHNWRKPEPGMLLAAAKELDIDLGASWAVGDAARDGLSAVTAGLPSSHVIIVGKGPGLWYPDLSAAVAVILPQIQQQMDALNNGGAG